MRARLSKIQPFILLLFVAISAIGAFGLVANVHAVAPAPGGGGGTAAAPTDPATLYIAPEVQADAIASEYRTSLALCLTGNNGGGHNLTSGTTQYGGGRGGGSRNLHNQMTALDAANGNWFTGQDLRPGVLILKDKADSSIGCGDLFKYGVLQSLNVPDPITLACAVGLTRVDGQDCLNDPQQSNFQDTSNSTNRDSVYASLDKLRTNASAPPKGGWNDAQKYVDAMQTLVSYCGGTPDANVGGVNANPTIQARDHDTQFNVVDGNGTVTPVYYHVPDTGKKAMLLNDPTYFTWWEVNCGTQLRDVANQAAAGYAAYVSLNPAPSNDPGAAGNLGPGASPGKTSCVINGVGWILCPVMNFMGQVTDLAYDAMSAMLTVQPISTDTTLPLYKAWTVMRNFANVAFVIAFLFITYSQITGMGLNNYGIKRLLPRIIVAAILVNISYWVCAIAVDASNILGSSLSGLLEGIANFKSTPAGSGNVWGGLTAALITGGTALYIGLAAFIPILLAAMLAIIVVVVVLTARQAIITLLIVISPLAFVAYLLPNTEKLFHKWRELLQQLLLMYPIIALIFGGSKLASSIIDTPKAPFVVQVMGAGVTIIPLAITPILMKTTSGVLAKIGGWVNNPNRGPFDRARKGAEGYRQNRQEYRNLKELNPEGRRVLPGRSMVARRKAGRQAVLTNRKSELNTATSSYISGLATDNPKFLGRLAQGGIEGAEGRALARALSMQTKLSADEVTAANAVILEANLGNNLEAMQALATAGKYDYKDRNGNARTLSAAEGSALQTAAIHQQFKNGDVGMTDKLVARSASMGVDQRQAIAQGMQSLSGKVRYYGGTAGNDVAQGKIGSEDDLNKLVADSVNGGKWSSDIAADSDKDALGRVANVMANPGSVDSKGNTLDAGQVAKFQQAVRDIKTSPKIKAPDARTQERLDAIANGTPYPPPSP